MSSRAIVDDLAIDKMGQACFLYFFSRDCSVPWSGGQGYTLRQVRVGEGGTASVPSPSVRSALSLLPGHYSSHGESRGTWWVLALRVPGPPVSSFCCRVDCSGTFFVQGGEFPPADEHVTCRRRFRARVVGVMAISPFFMDPASCLPDDSLYHVPLPRVTISLGPRCAPDCW